MSGKPRTGKSTVLLNLVIDDFRRGRPACVIDPHGELISAILERLPVLTNGERDRVVVFDPRNLEYPIGIDLLDAADPFEQDHAIQLMIELIERVTPDFARGPMLYQAVRNAMRLLFDVGGRLTDLPELLTNKQFLEARVAQANDPLVRRYWKQVWPGILRSSDGPGFAAYITSKFSQFFDDRCLRNIFGQRGGLDLRRAIDRRQLLLFDLGRGKLGAFNSQLLGLVILHCIERVVLRGPTGDWPIDVNAEGLSVYIDEVQEFAVENLGRMITAFPKHYAALVLANQAVGDLSPWLQNSILGSMGTLLMLRQGIAGATRFEELTQPRFDDRDLASLSDHEAILRTDEPWPQRVRRVHLAPPAPVTNDNKMIAHLRAWGALRIGRRKADVEAELLRSFQPE